MIGQTNKQRLQLIIILYYLRYEAEEALENKPEGSFLLRDSAQDEYIFRSVSTYSGQ